MRAPQPRAILCAAVLLTAPLACTKTTRNTNVKVADGEGGAPQEAGPKPGAASPGGPRGPVDKIQLSGSVVGLGDMFDAAGKLITMWNPPEPGAPPVNIKSFFEVILVQEGFGPGFLESINLDGVHAAEFAFPSDDSQEVSGADIELRMALSAHQPVRVIESLPTELQPQPMGDNVWQFVEDDVQLLFRPQTDVVEIAMSMPDLDAAGALRQKVPTGPNDPRIRLAASNLPPGEIDVSDMIPLPPELSRPLSSILNETESIDLAADFGTDRDLTARLGAAAPFERLGLDPIGPATQAPSALAKSLPGEAMLAWLMPWGDPAMLHTMLDERIPVDEVPAPFDGYVDEVIKGAHGILAQVRDEVIAAVYLDAKGQMTLVLAASVSDEKAAQAAMREIWTAAEKAFKDHIALAGTSPDHAYSVSFKQGAIKAGKARADLFTLTAPKDMHDELEALKWLVGSKPKLEVSTLVADGRLIVAIGVGQKAFLSAVARTKGDGLEAGGGLALARKITDGCQYCVAVDPEEIGELIFTHYAGDPDEPAEVQKAASEALKKMAKLDLDGEVALAVRLDKGRGELGFGVPKSLLFADPAKIKALVELMDSIDDAREAAWSKSVPGGVPGGVPKN